jgi:hypothetical protein
LDILIIVNPVQDIQTWMSTKEKVGKWMLIIYADVGGFS